MFFVQVYIFEAAAQEWLALKNREDATKARRLNLLTRAVFPQIQAAPLTGRAKMMQQWADMLETWKKGGASVTHFLTTVA